MSMQKVFDQSPFIKRIRAETARNTVCQDILKVLEKRLGSVPEDIAAHLRTIEDETRLDFLFGLAIECATLEAFRAAMSEP
jgi:hypothetical protein